MSLLVHGIPSCGTVKKARAWLDQHGVAYTFVDLRESPPSASVVATWVKHFGDKALRNTSGGSYRALGPEKDGWSAAQWSREFTADPMLIKRPVVTRDGSPLIVGWNLDDEEILARLGAPAAR
ncbi:MAG: arsenate reductase family protein [Deltaproteobacteria bacterium]|nr:arsenate reductase family protein [Deltaproteobacteria bacterium]